MPSADPWLDILKDLLCRLYKEWGGDCAGLPSDMRSTIAVLNACYIQYGNPRPSDPDGAAEFDALLTELRRHLDLPENSLDSSDDADLSALLAQLKT